MTTNTRNRLSRRAVVILATALILLAGVAAAANPIVTAATGRSIGVHMLEQKGELKFDQYATAAEVPTPLLPSWFPKSATTVTVVRPGAAEAPSEEVRLDAVVPTGTVRPGICTPSDTWGMPFMPAKEWPDFKTSDLFHCDNWTLAVTANHWYMWRVTA